MAATTTPDPLWFPTASEITCASATIDDEAEARRLARANWPTRVMKLGDDDDEFELCDRDPGELLDMVWPLTIAAYAAQGIDITKIPMRKDIAQIYWRRPKNNSE